MKCVDKKYSWTMVFMLLMILVYISAICLINFLAPPGFYDSDMYTDIRYAMEAWKSKSVFPGGWVFGNQLYVVSTPVLAAVFYGMTGKATLAMGLASTAMALFVLLSFNWMIQPAVKSLEGRLTGILFLLSVVLYYGDAWHSTVGWQLLFTMCSYYACYAVTVFLAFGCWLRSDELKRVKNVMLLLFVCFLSYATGIQSLRQTAVMTLPLMAAEFLRILQSAVQKKHLNRRSLIVTGSISSANILGVITARCLDLEQVEIIGSMSPVPISEVFANFRQSILLAGSLVINHDAISVAILVGILLICLAAVIGIALTAKCRKNTSLLLLAVLLLSVMAILAVDTLTTMLVRSIYYFMLFPLIAFLAAWLYSSRKKWGRGLVLFVLSFLFVLSCSRELSNAFHQIRNRANDPAYEISTYLLENGYTTVYGAWNQGADVAIASDEMLSAGFWEYEENPFFYYKYLCNPEIFKADNGGCVYLFYGQEDALLAIEKAQKKIYAWNSFGILKKVMYIYILHHKILWKLSGKNMRIPAKEILRRFFVLDQQVW